MTDTQNLAFAGAAVQTFRPTSLLRILRRRCAYGGVYDNEAGCNVQDVLQQGWACVETGGVEYRDIPVVYASLEESIHS